MQRTNGSAPVVRAHTIDASYKKDRAPRFESGALAHQLAVQLTLQRALQRRAGYSSMGLVGGDRAEANEVETSAVR